MDCRGSRAVETESLEQWRGRFKKEEIWRAPVFMLKGATASQEAKRK